MRHVERRSQFRPLRRTPAGVRHSGAGAVAAPKRAPTVSAWRAATTKIFPSPPGFFRSACARISTACTPTAASPTISATKSATRSESLRLLDEWEEELNATYLSLVQPLPIDVRENVEKLEPGPSSRNPVRPTHPVFVALRETIRDCDIPREPFADLLKAFRQDQTVGRYPTFDDAARLLPLLRQSRRPSRALRLRLSRRRAPAAFRFHLHRAAIGEFLAGRLARLRQGTHLYPARKTCSVSASPSRTSPRAAPPRNFAS